MEWVRALLHPRHEHGIVHCVHHVRHGVSLRPERLGPDLGLEALASHGYGGAASHTV